MTHKISIDNPILTECKSKTYAKKTGCGEIYITIAYKIDQPDKIDFIKISGNTKTNDCGSSYIEAIADLATFGIRRIRNNHEALAIVKALKHNRCNKIIPNQEHIVSCADAVGRALEEALKVDPISE